MTTDLRDLLELASDDLPEADLAMEAWTEARRQRRAVVRRTVLAAGAVALTGAVVAAVGDPNPEVDGKGFARLRAAGMLDDVERERLEADVDEEVEDAAAFAEAGTSEPVSELERFVYSDAAARRP